VRDRRAKVLLILIACLLVPGGIKAYHTVSWLTPDGQQIKQTVLAATDAQHIFDGPLAAYRHRPVPPTVIVAEQRQAFATARRIYTGHLLTFWLQTYRALISRKSYTFTGGSRFAYWHFTSVRPGDLSLYRGAADASVTAVGQTTPGSENISTIHYHLVHCAHGWQIDRWDETCESGCP